MPIPRRRRLSTQLAKGVLPRRFTKEGFALSPKGRITAPEVYGVQSPEWNNLYQRLYNASSGNIFGGRGAGGPYDPTKLYATPRGYVNLATGAGIIPSGSPLPSPRFQVPPERLDLLRQRSGYGDTPGGDIQGGGLGGGPGSRGKRRWTIPVPDENRFGPYHDDFYGIGGGIPAPQPGPGGISGPRPDKGLNQYGFTGPENRGGPGWAERFPQGPIAQGNILPGGPQGYYPQGERGQARYTLPDGRSWMWVPGTEGQGYWQPMNPEQGNTLPPGFGDVKGGPFGPGPQQGGAIPWAGPGAGPGGAYNGAPGGAQAPQGAPGTGLPLSGAQEAAQRQMEDALAAQLAQIGVAWDQIPAVVRLVTERLGTAQANDLNVLRSQLAGRGVFDSSIRTTDEANLAGAYDRQRQDLAFDAAQQYQGLSNQMADAYSSFQKELADLMLLLAGQTAEDRPPTLGGGNIRALLGPQAARRTRRPRPRGGRRRGKGNR